MTHCSRRVFLRRSGAAALLTYGGSLAWGAPTLGKTASDQEILSRCAERIRQHRLGDGTIQVQTGDGRPVPQARVRLEQTRHEFLFGSNIFGFGRQRDASLQEAYNARFATLLNYATLGFYWPSYEPQRGQPMHARAEETADWCRAHGILCKGHPLVWDFADPRWLPRDFEEIKRLSHGRVKDCIQRFAGKIDRWDVVNEPTQLGRFGTRMGEWAQSLGAVPYVRQHLETAREAGPQATLLVNDYRVDEPYYEILDQLRAGGKLLFDVVGIQSHMHHGVWPLAKVWEVCDRYAQLGVALHFTETTVLSGPFLGRDPNGRKNAFADDERWGETTPELEQRQADDVVNFYTALFGHPAVQAVTWWDLSDAGAWKRAAAGWLRRDMSAKPVYEKLQGLIKGRWWSKHESSTDAQGKLSARLYFGDYHAVITLSSGAEFKRTIAWPRQSARSPVITV